MVSSAPRKVVDKTFYPIEDDVGEHEIQTYILELLRPLLERYLRERRIRAHAGSDQFIYWEEGSPTRCVAPDIYVLPGVPQDIAIDVWKVWERGPVPSFALEVIGSHPNKDYELSPKRYAELGVQELVMFDPFAGRKRVNFQVYRREARRFRCVTSAHVDRVRSRVLGCYIRAVGKGSALRLRLGTGTNGDTLFPTGEEAERAAKEAERAAKEEALAGKEAERAAKEEALTAKEAERAAKEAERAAKEEALAAKEAERAAKEEALAGKEAALARVAQLEASLRRRKR